jgi:uncharacterized membrane protein YhiD involved in acid resistance
MTLEENIKRWVYLDNQLTTLKDKSKIINDERKTIESNILTYVEENNLENATAKISDGKLKFITNKQTSPLTFKQVEDSLYVFIKDENKVKEIIEHIKNNRDVKYVKNIKRYFDKDKLI